MIDTLFSGLIHGGAYALVAVGVSLIFGVTNVVNFAQGSLVAVGMMLACVNVTGDAVITLITAKAEHKLDLDVFRSKDA